MLRKGFFIAIMAIAAFSSCSSGKPEAPVEQKAERAGEFTLKPAGSIVLSLAENFTSIEPAKITLSPGPTGLQRSVSAIQRTEDGLVLVAVNRDGIYRIESITESEREGQTRIRIQPVNELKDEFANRTVGNSWLDQGRAVFFLYSHPDEPRPTENRHAFIVADSIITALWKIQPELNPGVYVFSAFPMSEKYIYLQTRKDTGIGFESFYSAWEPIGIKTEKLTKTEFERIMRPSSPASAEREIEALISSLAGPLLVECQYQSGRKRVFLRGDIDRAVSANAWYSQNWQVLLARDGRLAFLAPGMRTVKAILIEKPLPRAVFRDIVIEKGLLFAVWEEDLFPRIGRSGILVMDLEK